MNNKTVNSNKSDKSVNQNDKSVSQTINITNNQTTKSNNEPFEISKYMISKLKENSIYTYKDLCNTLKIDYVKGKSKILQLENLSRYFKYTKEGTKFKIIKIYDTPLPPRDDKRCIYANHMEILLLDFLLKLGTYEVDITTQNLWHELGMVNDNYISVNNNDYQKLKLIEDNEGLTLFEVNDFFRRSKDKLSKILSNSLNRLQDKRIIEYKRYYMIAEKNEDGVVIHRPPTDDDMITILGLERKALKKMKMDCMEEVYARNLHFKYRNVLDELIKTNTEWDFIYLKYHIVFSKEVIYQELPRKDVLMSKILLNSKIVEVLDNNAENSYEKNKQKIQEANEAYDQDLIDFLEADSNYDNTEYSEILEMLRSMPGYNPDDDVNIQNMINSVEETENQRKLFDYFDYPDNYVDTQKMLSQKLINIKR